MRGVSNKHCLLTFFIFNSLATDVNVMSSRRYVTSKINIAPHRVNMTYCSIMRVNMTNCSIKRVTMTNCSIMRVNMTYCSIRRMAENGFAPPPPPPREFCRHILSCRELKAESFKRCLHSVLRGVSL